MRSDCVIIGTSNSIRSSGYRPLLATMLPDVSVELNGIGATPSVLLPYILGQPGFKAARTIIVDTSVNDSSNIHSGLVDRDVCNGILFECLKHLMDRGTHVILLIMPQQHPVDVARDLRVQRLAIARKLGISVVDGYEILDALREACSFSDMELFDDNAHAALPVCAIIAQRLARLIQEPPAIRQGNAQFNYENQTVSGDNRISRQSSLFAKDYAVLVNGDTREFSFDDHACLVGIAHNMVQTLGYMHVASEAGRDIYLPVGFDNDSGRLKDIAHIVFPLRKPFEGRDFRVVFLDRLPPNAKPDVAARQAVNPGAQGKIEIEALVFRRGSAEAALACWRELLDVGIPAEPPKAPLRAEERLVAAMTEHATKYGIRRSLGRVLRSKLDAADPIWKQSPIEIALHSARLAVAAKDAVAARRILRQAMKDYPNTPELKREFQQLMSQASGLA